MHCVPLEGQADVGVARVLLLFVRDEDAAGLGGRQQQHVLQGDLQRPHDIEVPDRGIAQIAHQEQALAHSLDRGQVWGLWGSRMQQQAGQQKGCTLWNGCLDKTAGAQKITASTANCNVCSDPPPLARRTLKSQNLTETTPTANGNVLIKGKIGQGSKSCRNNTYCCCDKGVVHSGDMYAKMYGCLRAYADFPFRHGVYMYACTYTRIYAYAYPCVYMHICNQQPLTPQTG